MAQAATSSVTTAPVATWRDFALLFLLAAIWSSSFMLIKVAVDTVPPMTMAATRLLLAAVMLSAYALWRGDSPPTSFRIWGIFLFIGFFGNALPFTLIGWGEQRIDSGLAAILMGIMPITTALLAHVFIPDEPLRLGRFAGVIIGFSGLLVLVGWDALAGLGGAVLSQLAVLMAAVCYAINTIFARRHVRISGRVLSAGATIAGTLLITPIALFHDRPWTLTPSAQAVGAIVLLGVLSTAIATLIYFKLLKAVGATVLSQINYLVPMMGVLWGVTLLGERPGWNAFAALALILAGIGLVNRRS